MNVEKARFNMVEQQIRPCESLGLDMRDLLLSVKREAYVPVAYRGLAFADVEIPLANAPGAIMLEPKIEAKIMNALQLQKNDRVLEIGAGSGFMAALLATRAEHVYTVELMPELATLARANLKRQGVANVTVEEGDGAHGWPAHAPYDVIVLSGSTPLLPEALLKQLKPGGRLFAVVGVAPAMEAQLVTCSGVSGVSGAGRYCAVSLFETSVPALRNAEQREAFTF